MPNSSRKGSLLVIFLTVFIDLLGFGIVLPLLPIYAEQFTLDESGVILGLLMSSFSIMQFLFAPVWGRLSDRYGRRPILMIGLAGSTLFYAIFGLATSWGSLTWMFVSRIGAGIAGATIPTAQAYIADTTTKENRTKGMALIGAAFGLGFTFGPLLAATALVTAAEAELSPWPGYTASLLSGSALLLAVFKLPESLKADRPISERKWIDVGSLQRALTIPTVAGLLITWFISVLSFANFESILSFLLKVEPSQGGFGYDLIDVLLFFALLGFMHAMAQGLVRKLAGRFSEANLATTGAVVSVLGFLMLVEATNRHCLWLLTAAMIIESTGFAFMPASLQSLISRRSNPHEQGGILGVGQSLASLARIFGHAVSFPLFYVAATVPFWTGAGLMAVALLLVLFNARRGTDYEEEESSLVEAGSPQPVPDES